ncbi:MAG: hypothetical protein K0U98_06985 [Deltaproteobacteria bacterium]|nr:hypothetical protein [Deltaproteobacteria bacterium]
MKPVERWSHHTANLLVGGTGLVYAIYRYGVTPKDPYSVVNHPWQPHAQHLHLLLAPLLIFVVGYSWRRHIGPRLRSRGLRGYFSGLGLAVALVPMVASGYLIQTAVSGNWRKVWVGVHLVTSGLWLLGYLTHQVRAWSQQQEGKGENPSGP